MEKLQFKLEKLKSLLAEQKLCDKINNYLMHNSELENYMGNIYCTCFANSFFVY